jgi:uncharacterized protein YndB with AHSA1/START domain
MIVKGAKVSKRTLELDTVVQATLGEVWEAWSTNGGVRSFLSPDSRIEITVGGPYELIFYPEAPEGERGTEGCRLLSYLPEQMISFEWRPPPSFPKLRKKKTRIILKMDPHPSGGVSVSLVQAGLGSGKRWDALYNYLDREWDRVLDRLNRRFTDGPADWSAEKPFP